MDEELFYHILHINITIIIYLFIMIYTENYLEIDLRLKALTSLINHGCTSILWQ